MDTTQLLKGVLDLAVLAVLREEDGYGYDILRRLRTPAWRRSATPRSTAPCAGSSRPACSPPTWCPAKRARTASTTRSTRPGAPARPLRQGLASPSPPPWTACSQGLRRHREERHEHGVRARARRDRAVSGGRPRSPVRPARTGPGRAARGPTRPPGRGLRRGHRPVDPAAGQPGELRGRAAGRRRNPRGGTELEAPSAAGRPVGPGDRDRPPGRRADRWLARVPHPERLRPAAAPRLVGTARLPAGPARPGRARHRRQRRVPGHRRQRRRRHAVRVGGHRVLGLAGQPEHARARPAGRRPGTLARAATTPPAHRRERRCWSCWYW